MQQEDSAENLGPKDALTPLSEVYLKVYLSTYDKQYDYGKWVLASLLAVHAGSIVAITQAGEATQRLFKACGPWLIYGIGLTLVAGGFAWRNFTVATACYSRVHRLLREGKDIEHPTVARFAVNLTLYGTPLVAIASLIFFFIAAWKALAVL